LAASLLVGPLAPSASAATPAPLLDTTFSTLLNGLRTSLNLGSFTVDPQLSDIARAWSVQMADSGVMSHNPALVTQATNWAKLGENVGWGGAVNQIFDALVASPVHMRNMSDPEFTRIGVGTVTDAQGVVWTTHVFMRPKASAPVAAPRVAATPTTTAPARAVNPSTAPPTSRLAPAPTTAVTRGTAAVPVTAPPTTVPSATTLAPAPAVAPAAPSVVHPPLAAPAVLAAATSSSGRRVPVGVFAGVLILLTGGSGILLRRSARAQGR